MSFKATQSGLRGAWYVGVVWNGGGVTSGLGGESILPRELPDQETAEAVADEMNHRVGR
jgi:hypothetical protein